MFAAAAPRSRGTEPGLQGGSGLYLAIFPFWGSDGRPAADRLDTETVARGAKLRKRSPGKRSPGKGALVGSDVPHREAQAPPATPARASWGRGERDFSAAILDTIANLIVVLDAEGNI